MSPFGLFRMTTGLRWNTERLMRRYAVRTWWGR